MTRQLTQLVAGCLGIWLLFAIPAWLIGGELALIDTASAGVLCLAPMAATMIWCHWAFGGSPEQQLTAVLGGTSVRLVFVIAGGIGLFFAVDMLHRDAFLIWVVVFYLATLTLEVVLIARRQNALADLLATRTQQPRT